MIRARRARVHGADVSLGGTEVDTAPVPADQPQPGASMRELAAFFARKPSPLIIGTTAASAGAARLWLGRWGWWDLLIPAIVLAAEPFVEWMVHVHLLHRRPTTIGRFTIDPVTARKHRLHHRNPRDLRIVMVPFQALFPAAPVAVVAAVWLMEPEHAAMAIFSGFSMLLTYEWVHYLIHSPHRPRSAWFRRVSRNHRLHHFRNEHHWFGVTTSFGDRVLGTKPDPGYVAPSPTVRTLGFDA